MDIKERFYANLEVIREQMSSPPIRPSGPPTRSSMNRSMDNKSFVDRASSPQEVARKAKQKAASPGGLNWQERSALGVDMQEAEQLDELRGYRKKKLFGKDPLVAVANRAINRMKLPPHKGKLSPEEIKSNRKNRKVSQMAFDRMPD